MSDITELVNAAAEGDERAAAALFNRVYADLHRMASARMALEKSGHTLQPTALINEVYLRLFGISRESGSEITDWKHRGHFFKAAAEAMRRILVDSARSKQRKKRGGGGVHELIDPDALAAPEFADEVLALNDALDALSATNPQIGRLVTLRYFGGLTIKEVSETMGISPRTGDTYWAYARAWLLSEIRRGSSDSE